MDVFRLQLAYRNSKLAMVLFGYELQRRLAAEGVATVVVQSLHPGACDAESWHIQSFPGYSLCLYSVMRVTCDASFLIAVASAHISLATLLAKNQDRHSPIHHRHRFLARLQGLFQDQSSCGMRGWWRSSSSSLGLKGAAHLASGTSRKLSMRGLSA
jgi:hypothetical protein